MAMGGHGGGGGNFGGSGGFGGNGGGDDRGTKRKAPAGGQGQGGRLCGLCRMPGHTRKNCPNPEGR